MSMIHQDDDEILMTENESYDSDDDAEIQMGEIEVRSEEFEDEYDDDEEEVDTNDSELSSPAITPSSASAAQNSADHTTVFSNSQQEQQNSSSQQVNLSNSSNSSSSTNVKSSKSFAGNAKECIKNCVRFGKLYKKGNNRSGFKGEWRQRIIVLSMDRKIYYYKTVDDKTPLGVLHLNDNCLIKRCDFQDGIDKQFAFKIEKYDSSKPDKQFVVHCSSEKEVSDWLQALTSATGRSLNVSSQATEQQLQSNKWYRTISEAIDAAYGGEKIFIYSGVYREQLIVQKSVILEGVVSLEANKKQQEARKKFDEEKTRRETVLQNRENVLRTMSIRVGPLDLSKQHSELAKQQDEIRRMSMAVSSGSDSPRHRGTLNRRQVEPVNDIVETKSSDSGYIEFGNVSDVVLECPYEQQPAIIYKTNGGILSNITIGIKGSRAALSNGTSYKKEVEDLITNKDEPMVNCIEMDNGSLTLKNCTINCHTGSGILCMNQSSIELDNCDIFKVRDMGIWTWDRSSVTARGSRVLGAGVDGIRLNGKSTVKLDNCQVINSGLFGVCAVDASVCTLTNCVVRQATADAIRVQNDANCNVVRSEISHSQEYGIGIYNQLDLMSITVTNDCKMEQNKLGDFAQKSQVKMIH